MNANQIIRDNWDSSSYDELAKLTGLTSEAVRKRGRTMGLPPKKINSQNRPLTPEQAVARDVTLNALGEKVKLSKSKERVLQEQVADLSGQLEAMRVVGNENSYTIPKPKGKTDWAVSAVAVL